MTTTSDAPSVLRDPAFLRLWAGTTASGLATWALPFVLGLAVLDRTLTAAGLGLVLATRTAGFLAAVPVSGVLADRHSRRAVVAWSGIAAALALPVMATGSVPLMAVAAAVAGAGQGACRPAFQALTAEVVAESQRQRANAAMTLSVRVTTLVGPALTALLATVLDMPALLLGIGLLWLAAALLPPPGRPAPPTRRPAPPSCGLLRVTRPLEPSKVRQWTARACAAPTAQAAGRGGAVPAARRFVAEFGDGVREARRHPWFVAGLAALTAVIATGYSATSVALPLVSRDRYGTELVLAGAMTAYTAGALAGAVLLTRWTPRSQGWAAFAGLACYGFAPLSLLAPVHPIVVAAAYAVAGLGIELFNVPWFTATQREVAPDKLARVSSLDFLLSYGLAPVGLALIAPAMEAFGVRAVLGACAVICVAAPAAAALAPTARHFGRR